MLKNKEIRQALEDLLERYLRLVNSGDAGFWNPEEERQVINARKALAKAGDATKQEEK